MLKGPGGGRTESSATILTFFAPSCAMAALPNADHVPRWRPTLPVVRSLTSGGPPRMCATRSHQESVRVSHPQQPRRLEHALRVPAPVHCQVASRTCMRLTSGLERCARLVSGRARCPGDLRRGGRIATLRNGVGGERASGGCTRTAPRRGGYR